MYLSQLGNSNFFLNVYLKTLNGPLKNTLLLYQLHYLFTSKLDFEYKNNIKIYKFN